MTIVSERAGAVSSSTWLYWGIIGGIGWGRNVEIWERAEAWEYRESELSEPAGEGAEAYGELTESG